ncbi:MAG: hypothetical protein IPG42_00775 [Betaproteobacteria bacterium]|jgi:uncharacterized protein (TIGR02001 family)|nr:hypothetical protein [Betaproteobacteria bacterium]MBP6644399.1 TorF family putative porin [Burkholderiaceae bacterium]
MKHQLATSLTKSVALAVLFMSGAAMAQTKAPEPDYTLSYNVGAVTEYRYRGLSQSGKKPALQAGVDFAAKSGVYLGAWASTISWIKDSGPGLKGPVEVDIYGGYKGSISETVSYDVGGLQYWYPTNNFSNVAANANTFELYAALTAGPVTAKYSHALTNLFGYTNSKNSGYLDISATFDLGNGFSVVPHIGSQTVKNNNGSYTDYSVAVNKDIDGLVLSATLLGTNWKSKYGSNFTLPGSGDKNLAGSTVVLGIKKNF